MPDMHATLSASSSHRWISCPPSALLNAAMPDTKSEYAAQGTDAHTLCEYKVLKGNGKDVRDPTEDLTWYDEEMNDSAEAYAQFVSESMEKAKKSCSDPIMLVEQRLDFSRWVPEGFGTGDCVIVADDVISVIDFKYGVGVLVEAEKNPQMMCYALGALELFDGIYDINRVEMTIFQPRRENVSTFSVTKEELLEWADTVLKPAAELAAKGDGTFSAGEHCQFCKVKATCRKRAEYNLELAKYDFEMPDMLTDDEVEAILAKVDGLISWGADIKEYALQQAIDGKQWNDWKVVEGRSNRRYTDEEAVEQIVNAAGYDPCEHKVLGITAMTKMLGKKKFEDMLGGYIEKPQGKPTLVPKSDKRPALNKAAEAADDFKEEN